MSGRRYQSEFVEKDRKEISSKIDLSAFVSRTMGTTGRGVARTGFGRGLVRYTSIGTAAMLVSVDYEIEASAHLDLNMGDRLVIGCFDMLKASVKFAQAWIDMMPDTIYTSAGEEGSAEIRLSALSRLSGQFLILDPSYYEEYLRSRHPDVRIDPVRILSRLQGCRYYPELETVLDQLIRYDGQAAREMYYESKFNEIMSLLIYYGDQVEALAGSAGHGEDLKAIYRAADYLKDHLAEDPSMTALARIAMMSPSKFKQEFKTVMHCTLTEYKQHQRLSLAKELLLETDRSLSDIAAAVGYKKLENFNAFFLRNMHVTPREYRKAAAITISRNVSRCRAL